MTDLPYKLSEGVTATTEGLLFDSGDYRMSLSALVESAGATREILGFRRMIAWHGVAKRLRYREGEPWCMRVMFEDGEDGEIFLMTCGLRTGLADGKALHRLAAILCDDAEAFRVLYNCIQEFGDE